MSTVWLVKLLMAHLLTDFFFQPKKWIENRRERHFHSPYLYWHSLLTAVVALIFIGFDYWLSIIIILVTHFFIDGWKSYQQETFLYFIIDQVLHLFVIICLWYFNFFTSADLKSLLLQINTNQKFFILLTAYLLLSLPASILIGQMTKKWRDKLKVSNGSVPGEKIETSEGLADAGKWIGILERMIILTFLLLQQYAAIGLLVTAKGLLRFNEKDRQEEKTEYVLIGSLLSISIALLAGLLAQHALKAS